MDLLTIGDSSIDQFMRVEDNFASEYGGEVCFVHGSKVPVEEFGTSIAGNALNVAVGTSKLGINTAVYSEVGDDDNAQRIIDELKGYGVNTEFIIRNKGTLTDIHPIIIYKRDRTIFIYHEKRHYTVKNWDSARWIYYSSIGKHFEDFQSDLLQYLNKNPAIGVAFNPGTYHLKAGPESIKRFITRSDLLFVNMEEAKAIAGNYEGEKLHIELQKMGPKMTIITNGEKGASSHDGKEYVFSEVYEKDTAPIVDKTGAGDAFSSGFLSAIIKNRSMKEALSWGLINSSGCIREVGAVNGLRTEKEILQKI